MEIIQDLIVYVILGIFLCICILGWWIAGSDRTTPRNARPVRDDERDSFHAAIVVLSSQDASAMSHAGASHVSTAATAHCASDDAPQSCCDGTDGSC